MKKLLAIFVSITIIFSYSQFCFATEESADNTLTDETLSETATTPDEEITEDSDSVTDEEIPDDDDTVTDEEENPTYEEDEIPVAKMWICTSYLGFFPTGHSWLYFENLTDEPITVGIYELMPDDGVSVGTYCNQLNGFGVYYNIESYKGYYSDIHSIETELTAQELETVTSEILSRNYWDLIRNCIFFSTKIWNTVSEVKAAYTFMPIFSMLDLRIKDGEIGTLYMIEKSKEDVFRLREKDGEYFLEERKLLDNLNDDKQNDEENPSSGEDGFIYCIQKPLAVPGVPKKL